MLSPTYLESLPVGIVNTYSELESYIIWDISRRIAGADFVMTPTAEWQIYKAQMLRLSYDDVVKQVARTLGKSQKEVRQLFVEAGVKALENDAKIYALAGKDPTEFVNSIALNRTLQAGIKTTNALMSNFCRTLAAQTNKQFSDLLDQAYFETISGANSYQTAVRRAIRQLAIQGLQTISYPSGHTDQIDVAVRRAVISGVNKTCAQLQLDLANEMDSDLVETTSHFGARPSHQEWQGQIFSLSGKSSKYPSFYEMCHYGEGDGICGWNCKHNFYPFFEGISVHLGDPHDAKESLEYYEATQKQRSYERSIRKLKRQIEALRGAIEGTEDKELTKLLEDEKKAKTAKLRDTQAKLDDWCNSKGLTRRKEREVSGGLGKGLSKKMASEVKKKASIAELTKLQNLKGPRRNRHYISSINSKTPVKSENTIIHPSINVEKDIEDIKKGLYTRVNEEYIINGRTYKFHGGRFYPVRGNGFLTLTPEEYYIIKVMSINKGKPSLEKALKGIKASDEDVARLTKIFEEWW